MNINLEIKLDNTIFDVWTLQARWCHTRVTERRLEYLSKKQQSCMYDISHSRVATHVIMMEQCPATQQLSEG